MNSPFLLSLPAGVPLAFALVVTRIAGIFVFIPLPVRDAAPSPSRIVFSLAAALALYGRWPVVDPSAATLGQFGVWLVAEAAFGVTTGLLVSFLSETLTVCAQLVGLQAGYGYASVIDPTTQADSDVLQVAARLVSGLLFFACGLDGFLLRALALSLERFPPGEFHLTRGLVDAVIALAGQVFALGLRLAFPLLGLLLLSELTLALVGRINMQLHLGSSAMPLKMLLSLAALSILLKAAPTVYQTYAHELLAALARLLGKG